MMGLTGSEILITATDIRGRKKGVQAGNKEYVTAIECINASDCVLDPFIVFKWKQVGKSWFDAFEDNWRLGVSPNGWISNDVAVAWLKNVFIPQTRGRAKGEYQLLILDGHGSHLTVESDRISANNKIISIHMPPHTSHYLQPLDVGCFGPLKRIYQQLLQEQEVQAETRVHVLKEDILKLYRKART